MTKRKNQTERFRLTHYRDFDPQPIRHRILSSWLQSLCRDLPQCQLVDWSCGSGIGTRILKEKFPAWDFFTPVCMGGDVDWITWVDFVSFRRSEKAYRSMNFRGLVRESPPYNPLLSYDFLFAYRKTDPAAK